MVVIGIILVLLGLALAAFVVGGSLPVDAGTDVSFGLFGLTVDTSVVVVFALGALTLLLLQLGVIALRTGARKSSKRRAELQRLRRVEAEVQSRQAAESQRNAAPTAAPSAAPAPFARRDPDASSRPSSSTPFPMGQSTSTSQPSEQSGTGSQPTVTGPSSDRSAHGDQTHAAAPASTRPPEDTSSAGTSSDTTVQPRADGSSSAERTDRPE